MISCLQDMSLLDSKARNSLSVISFCTSSVSVLASKCFKLLRSIVLSLHPKPSTISVRVCRAEHSSLSLRWPSATYTTSTSHDVFPRSINPLVATSCFTHCRRTLEQVPLLSVRNVSRNPVATKRQSCNGKLYRGRVHTLRSRGAGGRRCEACYICLRKL